MFKNVLVGVDGRPNGRDAIALASQLTDAEVKLTLAFVRETDLDEDVRESARLLQKERLATGVHADLIGVLAAGPGRGLHEQAEKQNADLLVVGSCSHGPFGRAMLGDDTRASLNGATCAVALAPRGYAENPHPIDKIGIAYNGSPESEHALRVARALAERTAATLHALEVVSIPTYAYAGVVSPAAGEGIDMMLSEAKVRMAQLPDVEGNAVYGLAGEELAVFGNAVDLLIVGSRGYGPVRRVVHGSTSNYLQRHARCPLLVLPRAAAASPAAEAEMPQTATAAM